MLDPGLDFQIRLVFPMGVVVVVILQPEDVRQKKKDRHDQHKLPNVPNLNGQGDSRPVKLAFFIEYIQGLHGENGNGKEDGQNDVGYCSFDSWEADFLFVRVEDVGVNTENEDSNENKNKC